MENLVWKQKLWQHLPKVLPQKPFNTNKLWSCEIWFTDSDSKCTSSLKYFLQIAYHKCSTGTRFKISCLLQVLKSRALSGMHCKLKTHKFAFVDNVKGKLKRKVRMVFVVQENKMQHRWSNSLCQVTRGVCGEPVLCKYNISLCHSRFAKHTFTHINV